MATRVISQHLKVMEQVRHLRRPHTVIATQRMRENENGEIATAFQSVEQASVIDVGERQMLPHSTLAGSCRPVNLPAFILRDPLQIRIRIYAKRMPRNLQHGSVVNGVSEAYVHLLLDHFRDGRGLARAAGHANQAVSDLPVFDMDAGSEHATAWDTKALYAFPHYPVIGGRDGPDLTANGIKLAREPQHLRKDPLLHNAREELFRRFFERLHGAAGVDGDHLTAHDGFIHLALFVVGIAGGGALRHIVREHMAVNLPVEKVGAGVAAPESAVAIKHGNTRTQRQN